MGRLAQFGLTMGGYDDTNQRYKDRDFLGAERARTLKLQARADADDQEIRDIASRFSPGGAESLPATGAMQVPLRNEGLEGPDGTEPTITPATGTVPGLPEQENAAGRQKALIASLRKQGKYREAEALEKAARTDEAESYSTILKGAATGEDPKSIQSRFNARGQKRIVNATKDGDTYSFQFEDGTSQSLDSKKAGDIAERLGIFTREKPTILPADSVAIDDRGNVVARGTPKPQRDYLGEAEFKFELDKKLERFKADLKGNKDNAVREKRLAAFLIESGLVTDPKEAAAMALEGKNLSPGRFRADIIEKLVAADPPPADEARRKAHLARLRASADEITALAFPERGKTAAPAAPKSAPAGKVPQSLKDDTGAAYTFTGRYTKANKPIYQGPGGETDLMVGE